MHENNKYQTQVMSGEGKRGMENTRDIQTLTVSERSNFLKKLDGKCSKILRLTKLVVYYSIVFPHEIFHNTK